MTGNYQILVSNSLLLFEAESVILSDTTTEASYPFYSASGLGTIVGVIWQASILT